MGIIQKLERLSQVGTLTIEGEKDWYIVTLLEPDGTEFTSGMFTLKSAVESVDLQVKAYNTRVNMGKLDYIFNRE